MISSKKRILCMILLLCTVFVGMAGYHRRANAAVTLHNTAVASIDCGINSSGKLSALLSVYGIKNVTTLIEADLYVEKRILGIFWTRVDIGYTNNVWHDSVTGYIYTNSFDHQLSTTGTYRVTVTYTVSGTGGSPDVITMTETKTY
ncbi:MAG: hypothetical protein K6F68_02715 [Clostridiales bacterium]|nr:hypothetical protein [Clostridiales bacterium]